MKKIILPLLFLLTQGCTHVRTPDSLRLPAQENEELKEGRHSTQIWNHGRKTEKALLVIHGLHESPAYMFGFSKAFYDKGYNVLSLRLPGHQTIDRDDLNKVKASEWIDSSVQALAQTMMLGNQVEVLGYSLGGLLAANLALKYPDQVKALYLVAPALALRNRVFAAGLVAGWSGDISRVCSADPENERNLICRLILMDDQAAPMIKEDIYLSPAAGFQVQRTIDIVADKTPVRQGMGETGEVSNYYERLMDTYNQLKVPIFMVNSGADTVIQPDFNEKFINQYAGIHSSLFFPKQKMISHLMLPKSTDDAFRNQPQTANPYFGEILSKIAEFQSQLP